MRIGNKKKDIEVYQMTSRLPSLCHEVICITKDGRPFHGVMKETTLNGHKSVYMHDIGFNGGINISAIDTWMYLDEFIDLLHTSDESELEEFVDKNEPDDGWTDIRDGLKMDKDGNIAGGLKIT